MNDIEMLKRYSNMCEQWRELYENKETERRKLFEEHMELMSKYIIVLKENIELKNELNNLINEKSINQQK